MHIAPSTESDVLVTYSRRGLWVALTLLLALGAYALLINVSPNGEAAALANRLFGMFPIAIVICLAAMRSALKGVSSDPRSGAMKAMLNDELRQQSLRLSYRNGLAAVLLAQPLLALLLAWTPLAYPVALMASATTLLGVATVLASLLVYDR
jgi:hypothetical protein